MSHSDNVNLKASQNCLALIKRFESCELEAYLDTKTGKVPTIGWGHTANVKMGDTCTQEQADAWLARDVAYAEGVVKKAVTVPLEPHQFDALVSFVYNTGPGRKDVHSGFVTLRNGNPSTLLRRINAGRFSEAGQEFLKWIKDDGVVMGGLVRRRQAEKDLFNGVA